MGGFWVEEGIDRRAGWARRGGGWIAGASEG